MPIVNRSSYRAPWLLIGGHLQTIIPRYLRHLPPINYSRNRILTHDRDFLDLDWSSVKSRRLAIISHGMEGSSQSLYVRGMVAALNQAGWDALVWNMRGCSGEPNRLLRWYHGGDSEDLKRAFTHVLFKKRYGEIALIGFSLGGNITLKFLGEHGSSIWPLISRAVVFSVPVDLGSSADALAGRSNQRYMKHFLECIKRKLDLKQAQFPGQFDTSGFSKIKTFRDLDEHYTAPFHGYAGAAEYYSACSASSFLGSICVPTLIVNAKNDPFLGKACYPIDAAGANPALFLETPSGGGHCGFPSLCSGPYWAEKRTLEFLNEELKVSAAA